MTDPPAVQPEPSGRRPGDRLDSWKEIAAYLRRDVTTVQRWERRENMPVHRHVHDKQGSVYAFRSALDAWARGRLGVEEPDRDVEPAPDPPAATGRRRRQGIFWLLGAATTIAAALTVSQLVRRDNSGPDLLRDARFQQLTDFPGNEQAAALSRDGKFAAFLSDRDGRMDVWVTQVGTGKFYNLTRDAARELVNSSVRTLGFSPDGALVTFWARKVDDSRQSHISIWGAPILGGAARPYLDDIAEFDWSADGTRLVYHTPGPGDPLFVRDAGQPDARQIFSAPPGLHGHFPVWSPDQAFIYFVQGSLPDRMDVWRIRPAGGAPERITNHDSRVSHPVFLNARTLLYLTTDPDGSGPWLHSVDVERRNAHRISFGLERYTSLAVSGDGRRLVATVASQKGALWRLPFVDTRVDSSAGRRLSLTTGTGSSPRLGTGYLLYVSSKGDSDSIWKLEGDVATELWSAPAERLIAAPVVARDGGHIAFSTRRNRQTSLYVANADGTNARTVTTSLDLQGALAWAPDGRSITAAAVVDGVPHLFSVPLDGRSPTPFVREHSTDPVWSPEGDIAVYSGPDIGTTFPVKAVSADGSAYPLPTLTLSRGERHLAFLPGGRALLVLRGELSHKNLWLIDLATGVQRQVTQFTPEFSVRDFDISADGREIVVEQVLEQSDIVLIEIPRR